MRSPTSLPTTAPVWPVRSPVRRMRSRNRSISWSWPTQSTATASAGAGMRPRRSRPVSPPSAHPRSLVGRRSGVEPVRTGPNPRHALSPRQRFELAAYFFQEALVTRIGLWEPSPPRTSRGITSTDRFAPCDVFLSSWLMPVHLRRFRHSPVFRLVLTGHCRAGIAAILLKTFLYRLLHSCLDCRP